MLRWLFGDTSRAARETISDHLSTTNRTETRTGSDGKRYTFCWNRLGFLGAVDEDGGLYNSQDMSDRGMFHPGTDE